MNKYTQMENVSQRTLILIQGSLFLTYHFMLDSYLRRKSKAYKVC